MLQAYIDESYSDGTVFIMAGYVATAERWAALADEWAQLLGLGPPHWLRIGEVHMNQMRTQLGMEQAGLFYKLVCRHLDVHISCTIRRQDLRDAFESISWPDWIDNLDVLTNPYFSAFDSIIKALATEQSRLGISGPVDVIFDDHVDKSKCLVAWDILKRHGDRRIRQMLGGTPIFGNSAKLPQLQAADILAYWTRASQEIDGNQYGNFKLSMPWPTPAGMRGVHIFYEPAMIKRNFRNSLLALWLRRAGIDSDTINYITSRSVKTSYVS